MKTEKENDEQEQKQRKNPPENSSVLKESEPELKPKPKHYASKLIQMARTAEGECERRTRKKGLD